MKKDYKISRLAIVCVMCASVSGAYGASSVRSLGGTGTYASASSAASATQSGTASASNGSGTLAAARGGSVRLSPSTSGGKSATSTKLSAGSTGARAASTPRLSVGKYLGATTVLSGGSSTRPGGTTGGSGGGMDAGTAAELQKSVDELKTAVENLQDSETALNDKLADKQDTLNPREDGYIGVGDDGDIYVDVDSLSAALGDIVHDGREVEIQKGDTDLQWRYVGDSEWKDLVDLDELRGPKGEPGTPADMSQYPTTDDMNQTITEKLQELSEEYASKEDIESAQSTATAAQQAAQQAQTTAQQAQTAAQAAQSTASGALSKTEAETKYATKAELDEAKIGGEVDLSGYAKKDEVEKKQDASNLTASDGWDSDKENDSKYPSNKAVSSAIAGAVSEFNSKLDSKLNASTYESHMADVDGAIKKIEEKQDKLTAGEHITIEENEISADLSGYATTESLSSVQSTAETAKQTAESASGKADTAQQAATAAQGTADTAKSTAETAKSTAESAQTTAQAAQSTASSAQETAQAAQTAASAAQSAAESAKTDISGKADKLTDATDKKDNIAIVGDNGNYAASDKKLSDYVETSALETTVKQQVDSALQSDEGVIQQAIQSTVGSTLEAKQDKLVEGDYIDIEEESNKISATGLIPKPSEECMAPSNLCVLSVSNDGTYKWVNVTETAE